MWQPLPFLTMVALMISCVSGAPPPEIGGPCPGFPAIGSDAVVTQLRRLAREDGVLICSVDRACVAVDQLAWASWRERLARHRLILETLEVCR